MDSAPTLRGQAPQSGAESDRLDTWKEIAVFLRRDVRTAQRWERTENLPVHRQANSKRGSVFAFKSEIDDWWKNRYPLWQKGGLEKSAADRSRQVRAGLSKYLPYFVFAVLTLVVFLVLGSGRLLFSDHTKQARAYSGDILTIAVLPFENLSSRPDDRHLAESITEDVISHLGENAEFHVISLNAATRTGPDALSPEQLARKYHSDALVTGTLMYSGDKIRITTQLLDARTGEKISADELDRSPQAVRSVGNDLARLISDSVRTSRWPHAAAP